MSVAVLDTDHFSLHLRGHQQVRERLALIAPEQVVITIITAEEHLRGRLAQVNKAAPGHARSTAYTYLPKAITDLAKLNILDYDTAADTIYQELKGQRLRYLEDLKSELIKAERVAVDEDGEVLVWIGNSSPEPRVQSQESNRVQGPKSKVTDPRPLNPDPQGEAEACFLKALEVARKQQAKSLELRSSTSLARLWRQQGKQQEAHNLLSEIYNWFTEGFDTKDLQEAKALLEELSHCAIRRLND